MLIPERLFAEDADDVFVSHLQLLSDVQEVSVDCLTAARTTAVLQVLFAMAPPIG